MKLHSYRNEYNHTKLTRKNLNNNPFKQFETWIDEAIQSKVNEPTAMSLVTLGVDGFPDSRIVLLKDYDENGYTFFTNYNSNKSLSIARHPSVALHFFWPELERQIKITGFAEKTAEEVSDRYFNSRPYLSQLAALISNQSEKIPSRKYLQNLFDAEKEKWANKKIVRPENWGGYLVKPRQFEFWQGRANRLHDRFLFEKSGDDWVISRLAP